MRAFHVQRGFTGPEFAAVLAILAVITTFAAVIQDARVERNEAAAVEHVRDIWEAQAAFHSRHGRFAAEIAELMNDGLLEPGQGKRPIGGYIYGIDPSPQDTGTWSGHAYPTIPIRPSNGGVPFVSIFRARIGARAFFVDETGVIRFNRCKEGEEPPCDDEPPPAGPDGPIGSIALARLSQFAVVQGVGPATEYLRGPGRIHQILSAMDANGDSQLTFAELFQTRPLALVRGFNSESPARRRPARNEEDLALERAAEAYLEWLAEVHTVVASIEGEPTAPIDASRIDPIAFLTPRPIEVPQDRE